MLASAVFFYGRGNTGGDSSPASLFDAYDLIKDLVGQGMCFYDQENARPHLSFFIQVPRLYSLLRF